MLEEFNVVLLIGSVDFVDLRSRFSVFDGALESCLFYVKCNYIGIKGCREVFEEEVFKVLLKHFDGIIVAAV